MRERRLAHRFWCADLVRVEWRDSRNDVRSVEAILEDISALGACVQVEEPIPVGAVISMSAHCEHGTDGKPCGRDCVGRDGPGTKARFSGRVSHCEYRDFGFFVGIRLSDETRWSSRLFHPRHLMNLAALADD